MLIKFVSNLFDHLALNLEVQVITFVYKSNYLNNIHSNIFYIFPVFISLFYFSHTTKIAEFIKMGNNQHKNENATVKNHTTKIVLNLRIQQIIIHSAFKMKLKLADVQTFPHGLDGLKIWEAGIILSRYAVINGALFKNQQILQLGSGVGIAGITIKKWTECKSIQMTDYHPQVIEAIKSNLLKNNQKVQTFVFDWRQREKLIKTYDMIIGSDIVYFGCPVKDLYMVFQEKLKVGGKGIIIIPDRKNYAELFLKEVNSEVFNVEWEDLKNQTYFQSPLENEDKAKFQYTLLWQVGFKALILTKINKNDKY